MSYVYESFERGLWTVGFYGPDGKFRPEADYTDQVAAGQRVHYLNGGQVTEARELEAQVKALTDDVQRLWTHIGNMPGGV
jgi:hypothetical protein